MDVNKIYCGDNFVIYSNIELLYCTFESNIMYVNYTAMNNLKIKLKK